MFTFPHYEVLLRALRSYQPPPKYKADSEQMPELKELLGKLVAGEGLLPPPAAPTGTRPPGGDVAQTTVDLAFKPLLMAILNTLRALPPVWTDVEVGVGMAVHASVAAVKMSEGIDVVKFVRIAVGALKILPIPPEMLAALNAVLAVKTTADLVTAPGGDA